MDNRERTGHNGVFLSRSALARRWDISPTQLRRLERVHPLYRPAIDSMPTGGPIGNRSVRYHADQVAILEKALLGGVDLDTAYLEWQVRRNELTGIGVGAQVRAEKGAGR